MGTIAVFCFIVVVILAFAVGKATISNPEREALRLARETLVLNRLQVTQPYRVLSEIFGLIIGGMVLRVALFVGIGWLLYFISRTGLNWLNLRSRLVRPQDGLFPIICLNDGLYDPNRDNPGTSPFVTLAALTVQNSAAIRADKIVVKQVVPQPSQAGELPDTNLPQLVNLADVCPRPTLNSLVLGIGQNGLVNASLYELMHVLAVGASGFGKSAFLRALIWQLAQVRERVSIAAIDINGSEFNSLKGWSKLMFPVARNTDGAIGVLRGVATEIDRRKVLYEQYPTAHDLKSYNQLAQEKLAPIVLLADEATNLLNQKGIGEPLREVVQTARQYGCYLLLAGQNAKHSVIDTQTRDNFSSRFCFHTSPSSYRTVLGQSVKDVSIKGRAWSQLTGQTLQQIQIPFVSREAVFNVLEQGAPTRTIPVVDVELVQDTKAVMIFDLLSNGDLSDSKIARKVYGYSNGRTVEQVAEVRRNTTTTTTQ